jgi:hypothetical protein
LLKNDSDDDDKKKKKKKKKVFQTLRVRSCTLGFLCARRSFKILAACEALITKPTSWLAGTKRKEEKERRKKKKKKKLCTVFSCHADSHTLGD